MPEKIPVARELEQGTLAPGYLAIDRWRRPRARSCRASSFPYLCNLAFLAAPDRAIASLSAALPLVPWTATGFFFSHPHVLPLYHDPSPNQPDVVRIATGPTALGATCSAFMLFHPLPVVAAASNPVQPAHTGRSSTIGRRGHRHQHHYRRRVRECPSSPAPFFRIPPVTATRSLTGTALVPSLVFLFERRGFSPQEGE